MPSRSARHARFATVFAGLLATAPAHAAETVIFLRHGEKPAAGLGQLSCKGLNRALALPRIFCGEISGAHGDLRPRSRATQKGSRSCL